MPCTHPLTALRLRDGRVVIVPSHDVVSGGDPASLKYRGQIEKSFFVPCGKCHDCRCNRIRHWATRMMHEAEMHPVSIFATYTYDNDHVPRNDDGDMTLVNYHWPAYMRELRRDFGAGIRFFQVGEYGIGCQVCEKPQQLCTCENYVPGLGRPHHHAAIFGTSYADGVFYKSEGGKTYYTSEKMSEHWPHGHCCFTNLTYEGAAYIAGYAQKKLYGDVAPAHYRDRLPEFITMSRRPGIGGNWLKKYVYDVYPHDHFTGRGGKTLHPSRYYDKLYGRMDPESMECIKLEREEYVDEHHICTPKSVADRQQLDSRKQLRINRNRLTEEN